MRIEREKSARKRRKDQNSVRLGLRPQETSAEQIPPGYSRADDNARSLYARSE